MANLLIIDDDDLFRATLRRILTGAGHVVHDVGDGVIGVAYVKASAPDIIISDIVMPNKDGIETILEIKKSRPESKILAISGGGQRRNLKFLEYSGKLGADRILAKPFRNEELLAAVNALLDRP